MLLHIIGVGVKAQAPKTYTNAQTMDVEFETYRFGVFRFYNFVSYFIYLTSTMVIILVSNNNVQDAYTKSICQKNK